MEADIYNKLLFFFEYHPFHNILHAKVTEIVTHLLDKSYENMVKHLLDDTTLIRKILDISSSNSQYEFRTGSKMSAGYMAFVRQIANKLIEMSKKSPEVANCLESIPEWKDYYEDDLKIKNLIENKPLVNDPRKKGSVSNDEDLEFFFKLKNFNPTKRNETKEDNKEENEEEEEEQLDYESNKYAAQKDEEDNKEFEDLICHEENDHIEEDQNELHKYFSNNRDDEEQPQVLSMQDLEATTKQDEQPEYYAYNYWKTEEQYNIDDLLQDYQWVIVWANTKSIKEIIHSAGISYYTTHSHLSYVWVWMSVRDSLINFAKFEY